jgi:hypothetical protein
MKFLAIPYAFFMQGPAYYKLGSRMVDGLIVKAGLETPLCPQKAVPEIAAAPDGHSGREVFLIFTGFSEPLPLSRGPIS